MCTVHNEQYKLRLFAVCKICVCGWLLHYSHAYHADFGAQTTCLRWVVELLCLPLSLSLSLSVCVFVITLFVCMCVLVFACLCYISVSCFLNWLPYSEIKFILYNLISSKFLPQKLKNGFAARDARWRVHSVTHQTNTGFVRCRTDLCVKVAKLRK